MAFGLVVLGVNVCAPALSQIPTSGLRARYDLNGSAVDSIGGLNGLVSGATPTVDRFGNLNSAYQFDGINDYIEIADDDIFSLTTTGALSVSLWIQPIGHSTTTDGRILFNDTEGSGYAHFIGKGTSGQHEWAGRQYSADNTEIPNRDNRISFYHFSPAGGLGAGSFSQEPVSPGEWIHLVTTYDLSLGKITLYKNGIQVDQDNFGPSISPFFVNPANGTAPVCFGTRDFASYFLGGEDDVYFYDRVLSLTDVQQGYGF
jgi:Concanavalin A-like lectin/glucanases superfamily